MRAFFLVLLKVRGAEPSRFVASAHILLAKPANARETNAECLELFYMGFKR